MPVFEKRLHVKVSPERLFAFHELPDAFQRLTPPWEHVKVIEKTGHGIDAGVTVLLEMRIGPVRQRWLAEHVVCDPPRLFKDVARSGPFRRWEHEHRVEPEEGGGAVLIDHITYELPLAPLSHVALPFVRRKLERMFAYRHDVTRRWCEENP
jgi:ligand-binding SRPBCC domain-containing protein